MKKSLTILTVALGLTMSAWAGGRAEFNGNGYQFYDAYGRSIGRSEFNGNGYQFYDAYGRSIGRSEFNGNGYQFYDAYGR